MPTTPAGKHFRECGQGDIVVLRRRQELHAHLLREESAVFASDANHVVGIDDEVRRVLLEV
jgi:hypothetical protein